MHTDTVEYELNCHISTMLAMVSDPVIIETISNVAKIMANTLKSAGTVAFCGNGGSAAQAQHFAAELMVRMLMNRKPYRAIALTTDTSVLTATANDFSYDEVFSRQVAGLLKPDDCLVVLSTSGVSPNCINALVKARNQHTATVAITGKADEVNLCGQLADYAIQFPSTNAARIQEAALVIGHILCQIIEDTLR